MDGRVASVRNRDHGAEALSPVPSVAGNRWPYSRLDGDRAAPVGSLGARGTWTERGPTGEHPAPRLTARKMPAVIFRSTNSVRPRLIGSLVNALLPLCRGWGKVTVNCNSAE